ncbi:MAG: DUF2478 domain-containing protein [Armatimonadetes bacterium]|nr:DUF2478 domain-containing protein [Armatimonadota bacterium]
MLLVAITGPVGSEKTTTLRDFAEWTTEQGARVDGFVSLAGRRPVAHEGADAYTWLWVRTNDRQPFAHRTPDGPFEVDPAALASLAEWAGALPPKLDLVVMDEFGKWEAAGEGILSAWPAVAAAKPRMVVVTLRQGLRTEIEARLGRRFDRVLDADDGDTAGELRSMYSELRDWERVGVFGATSGGLECSLGTYLHATRFPFTGTVMGSLQAATLALASRDLGRKELVVWISSIAAGLKAFSPSSARFTPMLAIAVQGFLFMTGAAIGRWTRLGFALGAFLVGLWAALQGLLIQGLFFGRPLVRAYGFAVAWIRTHLGLSPPNIWVAMLILCLVNGLLSVGLTMLIVRRTPRLPSPSSPGSAVRRQWLFWTPLVVVCTVLFAAGENPTSLLWVVFRYAAVSAMLFGLARALRGFDLEGLLHRRGLWGPAVALRTAKDERKESA